MTLAQKIEVGVDIVDQGFRTYDREKLILAWTGGKDSTIVLWLAKQAAQRRGVPVPKLMFINEGAVFEEVLQFKDQLTREWNLDIVTVQNDNVLAHVRSVGDVVRVKDLSLRNQEEIRKLGYEKDTFVWEPESLVGNHLMKTVAMNLFVERLGIEAVITGVRWDEHEARSKEIFISPRETPPHVRIQPILHFRERDIWTTIQEHKIPVNPLYAQGYRSLGTKDSTKKTSSVPAWEQDLDNTDERGGRRQDKEGIMERLRQLGYM